MAQTIFPSEPELEENPKAMLFDGWGFVPIPETDVTPAEKIEDVRSEAA